MTMIGDIAKGLYLYYLRNRYLGRFIEKLGLKQVLKSLRDRLGVEANLDYNEMHARWACMHRNPSGKKVLVVGCNTGKECSLFVELGAKEVHGVDVVEGVGKEYSHPRIRYHKCSVESLPFPALQFDLVFCFATMEHVCSIDLAFSEMARVTKWGGLIYCVSSPLWNSRNGHHFPQYFGEYPWIHLRRTQPEVLEYAKAKGIRDTTENLSIEEIVGYIFAREHFNRERAARYVETCGELRDMISLRNTLDFEPEESLPQEVKDELSKKGYTSDELRAVTHTYIAKKRKWTPMSWIRSKLPTVSQAAR
jgi:ubiquinone/menaquinone biosynthesis C-methylase UbiE